MNFPLLCLHSSGLSGGQWERLAGAFSDRKVLTPDLIGYGGEPVRPQLPFELSQELDRLEAMLCEPSVVVGHSYGGYLALALALRRPAFVSGLVVFDPIVWGVLASKEGLLGETIIADPRFSDPSSSDEEWLESFVSFWGDSQSWERMSPRAKQSMLFSCQKLRAEVSALSSDRTPHTTYGALGCPSLLMYGEKSPRLEQRAVQILHESIPGSQCLALPGGHMSPITHHHEFLEALQSFLRTHAL